MRNSVGVNVVNTKSGVTIFMDDINFHYWRGI
jgi:hypothetical protein